MLCSKALKVELIGFGNASKVAYGCAVYIRSLSTSGEIKVSLLCSKSRVTPIKEVSIPRLELCAAELLSKLIVKVQSSLDLEIHGVHLYSDSTVVLAWIATPPHALKDFVANRITKIQNYTKDFKWHYVNTAGNPADLISRGVFPSKIQHLDIWWNGPSFLSSSSWPNFDDDPGVSNDEYLLEVEGTAKTSELNQDSSINLPICNIPSFLECLLEISNNYSKTVCVLAFIFRFINNCKFPTQRRAGFLRRVELKEAKCFLIKYIQMLEYKEDIKHLKTNSCVNNTMGDIHKWIRNDEECEYRAMKLFGLEVVREMPFPEYIDEVSDSKMIQKGKLNETESILNYLEQKETALTAYMMLFKRWKESRKHRSERKQTYTLLSL
ncbi:hypothetical protein AVEN_263896-1 [Araneus ventricosus]|uniref:Uncharacterized protein n=1 Tax=Araneus ventricosus TaxID=182803 RepID=A0A4Y2K4A2_ARAVE|nr:hypothetical protein AVEN_263896-1 [Araneus ventricosus]